jgi:uncharacterized membrane protein (UPF0127 family)
MKKVIWPIMGAAAFIVLVGLLTKRLGTLPQAQVQNQTPAPGKQILVGAKTITVELANTPASRQKGLGDRASLGVDQGMLFVFDQKQVRPNFWMKDMKFSIDIIWISNDKVVQIDKAPAEPGVPDSGLKVYIPAQAVDYVLEVNSGFSTSNNITVGTTVQMLSGL